MRPALIVLVTMAGCAAEPDWNAAAQQALADGRASLAVLGAPASPPAPREPTRIRPLRAAGLPVTPLATPAAMPRQAGASPAVAPAGPPAQRGAGALSGPPPASASDLTGSAPDQLVAILGEPDLRRAEGPVSIWLYSAAGCQLDVMFYPGAQGLRVVHIQARAGGFAQRTEAACLRDLAGHARRRQGRMRVLDAVG